jgi:hypothetical protein
MRAATEPANYPLIFAFEPTVPRNDDTGFQPNRYVPIDSVFDQKMAALQEFRSQQKLPDFYSQWAQYRGFQARQWCGKPIRFAEAFYRHNAVVSSQLYFPDEVLP